jgi:HSP20 family molecular chaperone IbpA
VCGINFKEIYKVYNQKLRIYHKMGLVKEVMKEIGNKSREFYEFVLPPIDMHLNEDSLKVVIDIPGFAKKDIELTLCGNILSIKAQKTIDEKESESLISNQRPNVIDKKIKLPIDIKQGEEKIESAKYQNGILTLIILVTKKAKNISIE